MFARRGGFQEVPAPANAGQLAVAGCQRPTMPDQPSRRLQHATALALQCLALLLLALHLYVYFRFTLSFPNTVPDQGSVETAWWGLWPVLYLPPAAVLLGAALVLAALVGTWRLPRGAGPARPPAPGPAPATAAAETRTAAEAATGTTATGTAKPAIASTVARLALPVVTGALFVAFYLFPLAHTRWGDAFMLAHGISYPDAALRLTHSWQAPLDVFLHAQTWQFLHAPLGWEDAAPAYRLLSPLAGLLYLLAALALSRSLARHALVPAWLTYGLLATLGLLQLFFGYVENYSFAAALILIYLWLAARTLLDGRPLWHAATVLALANATHPSTIILSPSLLYLGWHTWRAGCASAPAAADPAGNVHASGTRAFLRIVLQIALPMVLIGGATFVWMEASGHGLFALLNTDRPGGGDASWFVPLWATTTRWERYTLFSWPHLRDWLNQQLLVAPAVLPALLITGGSLLLARVQTARTQGGHTDGVGGDPATVLPAEELPPLPAGEARAPGGTLAPHRWGLAAFLLVAAGFYALFTFAWNPDYGGQRDWDLFSLAAIPAALLLAVLLPPALPDKRALRAGALPLLVLQGWHTAAWIYQNTLPWQWPD
jgi:hypothetical protein